ncbi:GPI mannosyltransferase 2-like [Mizuhopecten yessoensis]|uniref:GPI mannosyltransferase 2 n=1 Tax=Mizuhopecten yessoensis TaxID=6573 RepID=A0A210PG76_MIZYE|nr:GPI mannosyltransferase 2-like [Mizuhopecten yessoensis]OWF35457.1 GPI mannosyltransferase 2 [Mizuhopecten yessoensis]
MADAEAKLWWFAVFSRFALFCMQLVFNSCVPDHQPDVFNPPITDRDAWTFLDSTVHTLLGGFIRWDGIYFLHIAEHGYTYENCLAFFPLYPMLTRMLGNTVFLPLQVLLTYRSVLIISGFVLNQVLFVKTVMILYKVGQKVMNSDLLAYKAALLFCINPASIFMSALYSEIIYSYLIFSGMHMFERNSKVSASVLFGLGALARSNGLLYSGLIIHKKCKDTVRLLQVLYPMTKADKWSTPTALWSVIWIIILPFIIYLSLCISPFTVYQYFAYHWFCKDTPSEMHNLVFDYGIIRGYSIQAYNSSVWCSDSLPLPYSHIQKYHWNVGFLNYYQFKQIPNFLLATPVTLLSVSAIVYYLRLNWKTVYTLDLIEDFEELKKKDAVRKNDRGFSNRKLLPYVIHLVFLTVFGWLFTHIQILTRMLFSSSPVLCWYAARVITEETRDDLRSEVNKWDVISNCRRKDIPALDHSKRNVLVDQILSDGQSYKSKLVFVYFIGYFVIGTFLFSNFLPWT